MAIKSNIQWTDATWNIARGCTKVDAQDTLMNLNAHLIGF